MPEIDFELCNNLRKKSFNDESICEGFFKISKLASDFHNSTFSVLYKYGFLIIFELSDFKKLARNKLCEIKLCLILTVLEYFCKKSIIDQ